MQNCTTESKHDILPLEISGGNIMFVYENNEQLVKDLKKLYIDEDMSGAKIAKQLGTSQQNFSKIMRKQHLTFDDVNNILNVLGYDLEINFKKREFMEK